MTNTGLLLRRPFESRYNAFRRFLVANHSISYSVLRRTLLEKFSYESKHVTFDGLADSFEQRYCREYQIRYVPAMASFNSSYKNCPDCARMCYHSYLYDYPWFRSCPSHHRLLVANCPDCKAPWPTGSRLPQRLCRCCGVRIAAKNLSISEPLSGLDVLAVLDKAVRHSEAAPFLDLSGRAEGEPAYQCYATVSPTSADWIALVNPRPDNWHSVCEAIGNRSLLPIHERLFTLQPQTKEDEPFQRARVQWKNFSVDRSIRNAVRNRLGRVIRGTNLSIGWPKTNHRSICGGLDLLTQEKVLTACFETWRSIVSDGRKMRYQRLPNEDYFVRSEFAELPPKPILMNELHIRDNMASANELGFSSNLRGRAIPVDLQIWFYEIQLWRTYLALLGHLSTFIAALKYGSTWGDYYSQLPEDAAAFSNNHVSRIHLDMPARNTLRIVVPQHHAHFSNESVLQSLSDKNHPNDQPRRFGKRLYRAYFGVVQTLEAERARERKLLLALAEAVNLLNR